MTDNGAQSRAVLKLCRDLFGTSNLIGTDLDDTQVFEVTGRNFPQQPDGAGIHVTFL